MNITQHRAVPWDDGPETTLVLLDGFAADTPIAATSPADPRAANGRASATPSKKVLTLFMILLRSPIRAALCGELIVATADASRLSRP